MAVSEDVLRLVRTVERLPREDQDKIMRIVDLLSLVPLPGVDDVIRYLERNVAMSSEFRGMLTSFESSKSRRWLS